MRKSIAININDDGTIDVNYQCKVNNKLFELEGTIRAYSDGRKKCYEFEPSDVPEEFSDYYDKNWESIDAEIINSFELKKYNLRVK